MQELGINQGDINKLADAGFKTIESVVYTTRKQLISVKGISENKVDKIMEAGNSIITKPLNFAHQDLSQVEYFLKRGRISHIYQQAQESWISF